MKKTTIRRFLQFTGHKKGDQMKKWWWLLLIIPVIVIWQAVLLYFDALSGEREMQGTAVKKAKEAVEGLDVTDVEHYYGTSAYQVVHGLNAEQEEVYVWVPITNKKDEKDIVTMKANEGWSKQRVKEHVLAERDPLDIIDIRLGMESGTPLWEVKYLDSEERYTYYYLDFQSGELIKRYSLKQKD